MTNPHTTPLLTPRPPLLRRLPLLHHLPLPALLLILLLLAANAATWLLVAPLLHHNPTLTAPSVLAYTLGLRHALDADHITAIDLTTRRLLAAGQTPVSVGTFFSLGHSTIVLATCAVLAATSARLAAFDDLARIGAIVGSCVSAAFLTVLAALNAWVLYKLLLELRGHVRGEPAGEAPRGVLAGVLKGAFRVIDRPWKMYPLGVLFGLGFDTSSEVALLALASVHGARGEGVWVIMVFPVLFTAGMCLVDTVDGAVMAAVYRSAGKAGDRLARLYYSVVLTGVTVLVAVLVGAVQVLLLVANVGGFEGRFWDGVEWVGEYYDVLGAGIVGLFVVAGVGSLLCYGWFKRWAVRRYGVQVAGVTLEGEDDEGESALPDVSGLVPRPQSDLESGEEPAVAGEVGPSGE